MNALYYLVPAAMVAVIMVPLLPFKNRDRDKAAFKKRMLSQLGTFALCCVIAVAFPLMGANATATHAEATAEETTTTTGGGIAEGMAYMAAALSIGVAAIGSGIAVAAAAPAAIGAFSEDPKAFGKALIFVALGEGIALYGVLISILILNKV